jgi:peptide/nickel transport system substrate-binding protein
VSFLSGPTPPNGTNLAHLENADYTRLVGEAMGTPGAPGCKLWTDAEAALVKAGDVVPVVVLTSSLTLRGVQLHIVAGNFRPTNIRMLKG